MSLSHYSPRVLEVPSTVGEKITSISPRLRFEIEHKIFLLELRENDRGRCLVIMEQKTGGGGRHQIIIPAPGLDAFRERISQMIEADRTTPRASS